MKKLKDARFSIDAARNGKLGLALSGGGFRAALFHVGVLAQMAERDLLRYVSVISTVSGGSIIGAFYYLKVKQLLEGQRKDDLAPCAEGYRQLVREVEGEFLEALQHNLRIVTFADSRHNARMLGDTYSPTMRLADLFNEYFYTPITGSADNSLLNLPITPMFESPRAVADGVGEELTFAVPKLVLNATALNTGHLFQFTSEFVGELQPFSVVGGTTSMPMLGRLSLEDSTLDPQQRACLNQITLGDAVAASCCVPGLLDPFSLSGLYRDESGDEVVVRLVDGGVFDNQGLVSLYEDGCTHFICSDASDLLKWQAKPEQQIHNVAMRANDIMMDRIRNELMDELSGRGGDNYVVFTLGDLPHTSIFPEETRIIRALSAIRTDLDAFTDLEAYTLMYYGFMLSADRLDPAMRGAKQEQEARAWTFTAIRDLAEDSEGRQRLLRSLDAGSRQFMKIFYLGKRLPYVIVVLPMLIPIAFSALLVYFLPPIPTSAWIVLGLICVTGIAFSQNARIIEKLDQIPAFLRFRTRLAITMRPLGLTVILGMIGAGASWINLRVFNRLFLKYGRLSRQSL